MTVVFRVVGLVVLVCLAVGVVVQYWPAHADPKSSDMHERLTAVGELVGRGDQESLDTLDELVSDTELRVAKAAIRAIGSRRDEAGRLKLVQIVAKNKHGVLRGTAAAELGNYEKTDYRLLTDMLLNDKAPQARAGAGRGLKRLHSAAALDSLVKALTDPDAETRRNAYEAIGAATGRWFEFDAAAPIETQAENIATIKDELAHLKEKDAHSR